MTRSEHPSGSDRIAEVAENIPCDYVVNIQGDEPLIDPDVIDAVTDALVNFEMATAATQIKSISDLENSNVVKAVIGLNGCALYFSRRAVPFLRGAMDLPEAHQLKLFPFLKHLGIYAFRRETLLRMVKFPPSPLEQAEKLEQLRALEHGVSIGVVKVDYDSIGVDTPEDVVRVEKIIHQSHP